MSAVNKEDKWCSSVAKYGKSSYRAFVKLSSFFGDKIVRLFLPRRAGWRVEDVLCKNVLKLHLIMAVKAKDDDDHDIKEQQLTSCFFRKEYTVNNNERPTSSSTGLLRDL
jgi:hypothetical protein